MKGLLGGKGANLAEMAHIGLPVPAGFTLTTEACLEYLKMGDTFVEQIWPQILTEIHSLEKTTGKTFGSGRVPLLVSVRSGAPVSMPGMMDTILNLGLNDQTLRSMIESTGEERFVLDCYRRFIQMFSNVAMNIESQKFELVLERIKQKSGVTFDHELEITQLSELIREYLDIYRRHTGEAFPQDPEDQLAMSIRAVFRSWNNPRARTYRKINRIEDSMGTAVNIVSMVYGNISDDSGTGVCFTRSPSDGEKKLYGEFLLNAQGEDVVAGIRTPDEIQSLQTKMPDIYEELLSHTRVLENHYQDMQDIEFTIERGKLFILQTRVGKRSAAAAVKIAVDMVNEGIIEKDTAVLRVTPEQVEMLLHDQFDPEGEYNIAATGLPASPGAGTGMVIFDPDEAVEESEKGKSVILVRPETTPDDVHGLYASSGVLTSRGGMTSHAAVVARGMGKPCVTGCDGIEIDLEGSRLIFPDRVLTRGELISINGSTGEVVIGEVPLVKAGLSEEVSLFLEWCDKFSALEVWANADTPEDADRARIFGARGIGLCRTEHMFMARDRLPVMQEMIISDKTEDRMEHLSRLQKMQKEDFKDIFRAFRNAPVIIRLLDPPLHEFLPDVRELKHDLEKLKDQGLTDSPEALKIRKTMEMTLALEETNPMLGFRGCRLGIVFPEIYEMQVRAIFDAVQELHREIDVKPYIMLPIVMLSEELTLLKARIQEIASLYSGADGDFRLNYRIGTMIELPRAAYIADTLAREADFFSFGTNDLTQTTMGLSRDDAEAKFLRKYVELGLLPTDPFNSIDLDGVGVIMEMAVRKGRSVKQDLSCGICGEHGGDPRSIAFCHQIGLDYVSCSPYRIPVARVAAAHAALNLQC